MSTPRLERIRPEMAAVLAFGSNLGDREQTIRDAIREVGALDGVRIVAISPLVESAAVKLDGVDESAPAYLNGVVLIRCALDPLALLTSVNEIEAAHGRVRAERWGDRTLDIDIITFDGLQSSDARLTLPHPRAAQRAFVLVPWLDVDPYAVLPGLGPVASLVGSAEGTVTHYQPSAQR